MAIALKLVTQIIGEPKFEQVRLVQEKLAGIAVKLETTLFKQGAEFGHMCMVVDQSTYCRLIRNPAWTYAEPQRPGAFDPNMPGAAGNVLQQCQIAEHDERREDYEQFRGAKQGLHEQVLYAVDKQYIKAMKKPLMGYMNCSPMDLLTHLFDNCALNDEWDTDDHITEFYWKLEEKGENLEKEGVEISNSQICIKLVKQMYCSGHFNELTMTEWERRPVASKTLAKAKPFFLTKCM
ncbi:hypothetical protein ACHAW6_012803 [Cyclotella cf. meneghiniana]